ncbi:hypothetical protein PPYR_12372 [Photinus pyralis]|uniref:NADH dehydrogenase [ubiquinone] 1 beta subcomplex subunit 11, mitochondrial n=1 Tax=Photinus pyralis TaxID=7054 RepID=A0A5N4ADX9_PHOPY|nr:NADH dehydrogenase [ubiquinone] 1 beta subcomplex subunit 11, mitochondrial-like [Photinus pyralis]KAB0795533.1 hypothetical protein PPYR_12372 [Photinus pyralis]
MAYVQRIFKLSLKKLKSLPRQASSSSSSSSKCAEEVMDPKKTSEIIEKISANWISYGFDRKDERTDRIETNLSFFFCVTLGLVCTVYGFMYAPDVKLKSWAQREAFIQLRRREAKCLKPIDCNLVDPSKFTLPSEDQLCDVEVII